MPHSMLAFAISAAVMLTTDTSEAGQSKSARPAAPVRVTAAKTSWSPIQQKLRRDTALASRIVRRLPAGTNLMTASAGFRSLGQFVAAVNASNNLGIPFQQFKRRMVNDGMTLGLAIQDMRPKSDYRSAAQRAEDEAATLVGPSDTVAPAKIARNRMP